MAFHGPNKPGHSGPIASAGAQATPNALARLGIEEVEGQGVDGYLVFPPWGEQRAERSGWRERTSSKEATRIAGAKLCVVEAGLVLLPQPSHPWDSKIAILFSAHPNDSTIVA